MAASVPEILDDSLYASKYNKQLRIFLCSTSALSAKMHKAMGNYDA
jgi:hypothetical protein